MSFLLGYRALFVVRGANWMWHAGSQTLPNPEQWAGFLMVFFHPNRLPIFEQFDWVGFPIFYPPVIK